MTIWILAVLFLASLAGLGYRQGAIRVAFSLFGIVLGGLLAVPVGHLLKPVVSAVGIKNPALLWLIPPVIVFVLVLTLAKVGGLLVHQKVEVYYKYKAGDLRLSLWERLNQRLGLCLGSLNAIAYVVLLSQTIYMISYWTVQGSTDSDPKTIRLVNRLGKDLESTGMSKVAGSVDKTSKAYYDAADIAGLLYQTPLLEARLSRYPGILNLAERPEFKDLANDAEFSALRQRNASIAEILNHPKVQAILNNADLLKTIETSLVPNLPDLRAYLETGESATFSDKILGRWKFDVNGSLGLLRREKPNITSKEIGQRRGLLAMVASKAMIIVAPESAENSHQGQALFKSVPFVKGTSLAPKIQDAQCEWKSGAEGKYLITLPVDGRTEQLSGEIRAGRMTISGSDMIGLVFVHED
ncbi:MAG TPA: CvpA family protein [Candidatus Paceibacterota bacterium]|nr:CvpA family protein [Candidatus Paceibacterota bacterium]